TTPPTDRSRNSRGPGRGSTAMAKLRTLASSPGVARSGGNAGGMAVSAGRGAPDASAGGCSGSSPLTSGSFGWTRLRGLQRKEQGQVALGPRRQPPPAVVTPFQERILPLGERELVQVLDAQARVHQAG